MSRLSFFLIPFVFWLEFSGLACLSFVVVVIMVIAWSQFALTFVGGVKPYCMLMERASFPGISLTSTQIRTTVSRRSLFLAFRAEPSRELVVHTYTIFPIVKSIIVIAWAMQQSPRFAGGWISSRSMIFQGSVGSKRCFVSKFEAVQPQKVRRK